MRFFMLLVWASLTTGATASLAVAEEVGLSPFDDRLQRKKKFLTLGWQLGYPGLPGHGPHATLALSPERQIRLSLLRGVQNRFPQFSELSGSDRQSWTLARAELFLEQFLGEHLLLKLGPAAQRLDVREGDSTLTELSLGASFAAGLQSDLRWGELSLTFLSFYFPMHLLEQKRDSSAARMLKGWGTQVQPELLRLSAGVSL